ncbi:hypothetical protein M0805_000098 [Coniferiporia weirii]|nr:hypothetical protein M0805_000098 [Coniferiporia weirii]
MAEQSVPTVSADGVPPAEVQEKLVEESPGIKVFAGNLDYSVTDEDLKGFFAAIESDILSCQVILRGTRSAGYGFVAVATEEAAQKAIDALNGQDLQGRKAIVELAKPAEEKEKERSEKKSKRRTSRRGAKAVPGEVTEAEANGEAEKPATTNDAEGEEAKLKKKKKRNVRKLKNKAKDAAAPTENGVAAEAGDGTATPATEGEKKKSPKPKRTPKPRRPAGEEPTGEQSKTTLFVANLPFTLDDAELGKIFSDEGFTVVSARVVRRRWGHPRRSKGYGFVDVGDETSQLKAIEVLQGKELEGGRQIAVKVAVDAHHEDEKAAEGENVEAAVEAEVA